MRILHRYYLKELVTNFFLTFGVLYFVALLVAIARWTYHSAGLDVLLVLKSMLIWSIDPLPHLIPVAVMISVVLTYGRASSDNEILAIRMGGIRVYHPILPAVFVGILLSLVNSWLLSSVIPSVYYHKHRMVADVASRFFSKTNPVNNMVNMSGFRMLWKRKIQGRFKEVWLDYKKEGICGFADEVWIDPPRNSKVIIRLRGFRGQNGRVDLKPGEDLVQMSVDNLGVQVDVEALIMGKSRRIRYHDMTTAQLVAEINTGRIWKPVEIGIHRVHFRSCHGLVALFFALVGAPIGIMFRRAGRMAAFGLSFFPILVYYGLAYMGEGLVLSGLNPVFVAWIPAFGLLSIAMFLNWRVFRQ